MAASARTGGALFGVAYGMDDATVAAAADGLYATLRFERWRTTRAEELSGGTRSKLNLAVALLADPEVLLLDEPYAGFDFDTYERFWDLTAERRSAGRSVVVIIHFITDQARFDRIVELRDGLTCASMSSMSGLVARRALLEYARKPLKLVMLVLVPVVLVFVWGPTLADFSKLSGGSGDAASAQS